MGPTKIHGLMGKTIVIYVHTRVLFSPKKKITNKACSLHGINWANKGKGCMFYLKSVMVGDERILEYKCDCKTYGRG